MSLSSLPAKQLSLWVIYVKTCKVQECVSAPRRTRRLFSVLEGTEHDVDARLKVLSTIRKSAKIAEKKLISAETAKPIFFSVDLFWNFIRVLRYAWRYFLTKKKIESHHSFQGTFIQTFRSNKKQKFRFIYVPIQHWLNHTVLKICRSSPF